MTNRLAWLAVVATVALAAVGIAFAVIDLSVASLPPVAPLPASLTLTGPPVAATSSSVGFEVVPSPSIDLRDQAPTTPSAAPTATTSPDDDSEDNDANDDAPDEVDDEAPDDTDEEDPDDVEDDLDDVDDPPDHEAEDDAPDDDAEDETD